MSESHNPYTAHELDPRIGGSTVDDTPTQPAVRDDNAENQQSTSDTQLKGLNATRRENYGEDETRGNEPSSERFTSGDNSLFVAGGSAATAAALSQQYENEREGSAPLDRKADNAYTGTTPSGSNSNYYGAPSGTAVAGSQQPHPSDLAATKEYSSGVTQPVSSSEQQYTSGAGQAPYDDGRNASAIDRDNEQSHTLRNAAIGAGAAGVGGYAYREHQKDDLQSNSQTDRYTERRDYQTTQANQQREARSYNEQPTGQYSRKDDDHRTRNTAVGASVAPGAAAVGAHQYREHKSHAIQPEDQPAGYGTRSGNVGSSTESRYQTDLSYTTRGIEQTQAGNYPSNTERDDKDSHAVRNTAIGAGAAGVGAHKYREHKDRDRHDDLDTTRKSDMDSHKTTIDQEQPASGKHEVHHKSKLLNKLDPRVHSEKKTDDTHEGSSKSHRRKSNASADASAAALRRRSDASSEKKAAKSHSLDDAAHRPAQAGHPVELSPGVQLPKGNHYGKDVHDPRYGLGLNRAGITQEEAEALRRGEVDPASLHPLHGNNSGKLHKEKDEMGRSSTHSSTEKKRRSSLLGFLRKFQPYSSE